MSSPALTDANGGDDVPAAPWRTLQSVSLARVLIAAVLLLALVAFDLGAAPWAEPALFVALGVFSAGAVLLAALAIYVRRQLMAQAAAQIVFDLVLISVLTATSGGIRSGLVLLFMLPLSSASLMLPTVAAFSVCSLVVITILLDTLARTLTSPATDASLFQAGIYGAALFAITGLLTVLAQRLSAQERLAVSRGRNLRNQLEINRLVIAQLEQGVVVVDSHGRVRANNRAARVLFGMDPAAQLTGRRLEEIAPLAPLSTAFARWRVQSESSGSAHIQFFDLPELRLRARFVSPVSAVDEHLIFIDDQRRIDERAQQLKLASMGRLTASIAHEIRNPLAAISHAGQMLVEDAREPGLARLAQIVRDNTQRLNRLVDDVLRVARREATAGDEIDLASVLATWLQEFTQARGLDPKRFAVKVPAGLQVKFEPGHLHQVLFNLLDNAARYASDAVNAVQIVADDTSGWPNLWVFDDGPGVADEARSALFEPFHTTHTMGTGLGLYIAREFCLANNAVLTYARLDGREGFVIRFAGNEQIAGGQPDMLDTIVPHG